MKGEINVRSTFRYMRPHLILGGLTVGALAASPLLGTAWYHFGPH